jgi:hypothetical protein
LRLQNFEKEKFLWHGASVDVGRDLFHNIFWRQKRREERYMLAPTAGVEVTLSGVRHLMMSLLLRKPDWSEKGATLLATITRAVIGGMN